MNCEAIMNTFKNKTTMSKTKLLYIAIISLLFILQACKRDTDCGDLSDVITNYNIADSNKAKIPYTGTDTLVFVSDANDTAVLIGQGKNTYYQIVTKGLSSGDCPRSSVEKYETIEYYYKSVNLNLPYFKFITDLYDDFGGKPSTTNISININNYEISHSSFDYISSINIAEDSIQINSKYIEGIYWEFGSNKKTLFNFKYGLLKFQYNNKEWKLNEMK